MLTEQHRDLIGRCFTGLNEGSLDLLLPLFSPTQRIRNAANPPIEGPDASRQLLTEFFRRTTDRQFELVDAAVGDGQVFACWTGRLTFPEGLQIAEVKLTKPLTVTLRGVERFHLDAAGKISELDIIHETTTLVLAARAAAANQPHNTGGR